MNFIYTAIKNSAVNAFNAQRNKIKFCLKRYTLYVY